MAFKSKYKGSEIEEIFDKVSTGKVGGGIEIVGSVDELDPDAPVGTMACVASETEIEVVKSFADAYQPTEEDKQSDFSVIKEKLTQITNVYINEDVPSDWWESFDYDTIYIMNDTQNLGLQIYRNENHIQFDLSDLSLGDFIQDGTLALGTWDNDSNYTGITLYQNSLDQLNNILSNGVFYYTGSSYNSAFLSRIYYKEDPIIDATTQLYIKKSTWEPFKTGGMTVVDSYDKLDPEAAVGEMATVFVPEVGGEKSIKDLVPGDVISELFPTQNWDYDQSFSIVCQNDAGQQVTIEWDYGWDHNDFMLIIPEKYFCMAEYGELMTDEWNEAKSYIETNNLTVVSITGDVTNADQFMTVGAPHIGGTTLHYKKEKSWINIPIDISGLGSIMTVEKVSDLPKDAPNGSIASVGIPNTIKEDVIENISQGTRISKIGVSPASKSLSYFEVLLHDESGNAMQITWDSGEQTMRVIYNSEDYYVLEYNEIIDSYVTDVTNLLTSKVFTFQRITSGSASDINHVLKLISGSEGSATLYYNNNGWKKLSTDLSTSIWKSSDTAVVVPKEYLQLVDYSGSIRLNNPDNLAMPEYLFEIKCNTSAPSSLTFYPGSGWDQINVLWANEDVPVFEVGYTYVISIMNNMAVYASFKH